MNTKKEKYYDIVAGPNKDALFDACKYAFSKTARLEVEDAKKRQEEEAYQKRVNEYWKQKRQVEQGQREENERQQQAREEAEKELEDEMSM